MAGAIRAGHGGADAFLTNAARRGAPGRDRRPPRDQGRVVLQGRAPTGAPPTRWRAARSTSWPPIRAGQPPRAARRRRQHRRRASPSSPSTGASRYHEAPPRRDAAHAAGPMLRHPRRRAADRSARSGAQLRHRHARGARGGGTGRAPARASAASAPRREAAHPRRASRDLAERPPAAHAHGRCAQRCRRVSSASSEQLPGVRSATAAGSVRRRAPRPSATSTSSSRRSARPTSWRRWRPCRASRPVLAGHRPARWPRTALSAAAARRSAARRHDRAAGSGRQLPRPSHGLGGAQRGPAPPRPPAGLVACPSTASCPLRPLARRRRAEATRGLGRRCGRSRPRPSSTPPSAWPRSRPSCARAAARSRRPRPGRLPRLVRLADLRGDCHSHSDWSDGREPLEVMVESARRAGREYQVLTDHSWQPGDRQRSRPERVEQQRRVIGELNERFAREQAAGELPEGAHPDGFRLLHGCELEITVDGRLDYDDALLAGLRRRRGLAARRPAPAARPAHGPLRGGHAQPARRHHQPSLGPQDRPATRPRPRLGGLLPAGRRDRHVARGQRQRRSGSTSTSSASAPRARPAAASSSIRTPTTEPSGRTSSGAWRSRGAAGWSAADVANTLPLDALPRPHAREAAAGADGGPARAAHDGPALGRSRDGTMAAARARRPRDPARVGRHARAATRPTSEEGMSFDPLIENEPRPRLERHHRQPPEATARRAGHRRRPPGRLGGRRGGQPEGPRHGPRQRRPEPPRQGLLGARASWPRRASTTSRRSPSIPRIASRSATSAASASSWPTPARATVAAEPGQQGAGRASSSRRPARPASRISWTSPARADLAQVNPGDFVELAPSGPRVVATLQRRAHRRRGAARGGAPPAPHGRRQQVRRRRHQPR